VNADLFLAASSFLTEEARLLDSSELDQWLALVDPAIRYRAPVRAIRYGGSDQEFSSTSFHFDENYFTLKKRVERLKTKYAWSEDPTTHYRHFISNVRVAEKDGDHSLVTSYFLLYRGNRVGAGGDFLTGIREDVISGMASEPKLLARTVYLDSTVLGFPSINTFI
jgi:3-phenylpropionate/cinnamic acid dioxygenase small subunit